MRKSIYQRENEVLRSLLRKYREDAGLSQVDVSNRLSRPQSYISKIERGERRLDVLELRALCHLYGIRFAAFADDLETEIEARRA